MLALGVAGVLAFDLGLRLAKARVLARVAGRFDYVLGVSVFQKLLRLPASRTERASASAQIARLKEFESVRDFFTGPLAGAFVELPFVAVMILAMALIGGPLVVAPLAAGAVFVGFAFLWKPRSGELERELGQVRASRQGLLVETVMNRATVVRAHAEATWLDRFRLLSARDCSLQERLQRRAAALEGVSNAVLSLSALSMLVWGASRVIGGGMTVGALIAVMALAWRVLAPIQTTALALAKLNQIGAAIRQTNQFFKLREEFQTVTKTLKRTQDKGAIAFGRVSFRYDQGAEPALMGVSFSVAPGEAFAITGANRSGKTTLFKLLLGLHAPQAGHVTVDGVDVRQVDPRRLRRRIAYVPQAINLFYGTIRQNLTFGHPSASDEMVERAIAMAGLQPFIDTLPQGLDTRIGDAATDRLPRGFARRLTIARALCRPSDILLLDEPEQGLDAEGERMLSALFAELKGEKTILLVTYRPSFVALAQRAAWLSGGMIEALGAPADVMKRALAQPLAQKSA
jgi:ATP-binding cassette subfamily C protein/ATP-binding cassette subfamily C protein LapB